MSWGEFAGALIFHLYFHSSVSDTPSCGSIIPLVGYVSILIVSFNIYLHSVYLH
jgi:hypothetical protein